MNDLTALARWLMIFGLVLAGVGGLIWLLGRTGLPIGRLPGDLRIETGSITCLVPLATSIVISVILTIALNLIARLLGR
ncbi:MAG TPA: DUF2905 domain-containing protein [Anaerolineales bacterium]|nr:DUF2905 domain-containing protein [Anaerolineales bacterium]